MRDFFPGYKTLTCIAGFCGITLFGNLLKLDPELQSDLCNVFLAGAGYGAVMKVERTLGTKRPAR